jgi:hypothetical protein
MGKQPDGNSMSSEWKIEAKTNRNNIRIPFTFHTFYSPPFWSSRGNQGDLPGTFLIYSTYAGYAVGVRTSKM